jgi:cAMP-specific phosphodiesterase 4
MAESMPKIPAPWECQAEHPPSQHWHYFPETLERPPDVVPFSDDDSLSSLETDPGDDTPATTRVQRQGQKKLGLFFPNAQRRKTGAAPKVQDATLHQFDGEPGARDDGQAGNVGPTVDELLVNLKPKRGSFHLGQFKELHEHADRVGPTPSLLSSLGVAAVGSKPPLPPRRNSWIAVGGGNDLDTDVIRVTNDDLQEAALRGDIGLVRRLAKMGASVNAPMRPENDDNFMTLLHILAHKRELPNSGQMIIEVLELRANINGRSTAGVTPLAYACMTKNLEAVRVLLDYKADVSPVDDYGRNSVRCAIEIGSEKGSMDLGVCCLSLLRAAGTNLSKGGDLVPIVVAVKNMHEPIVRALLENNAEPDGMHSAVEHAPFSIIRMLAEAESNPFRRDDNGKTVMDIALQRGDAQILTLLRQYIGDLQRQGHPHLKTQEEELRKANREDQAGTGNHRHSELASHRHAKDEKPEGKRSCIPDFVWHKFEALQGKLKKFNRDKYFQIVMFIVLMLALFLPDFWIIFSVSNTDLLDGILVWILCMFTVEFLVQLIGLYKTYAFKFFFYVDIIGIFSVLIDHSVFQSLFPAAAANQESAMILRIAKMAKLGARASRFTKLVKLLSLIPGMKEQQQHAGTAKLIAARLNLALSTRVSCLIILCVLVLPAFDIFTFPTTDNSPQGWVQVIQGTYVDISPDIDDLLAQFYAFYEPKGYFPYEFQAMSKNGTAKVYKFGLGKPSGRSQFNVNFSMAGGAQATFNFEGPKVLESICTCLLMVTIIFLMIGSALIMSNVTSAIVLVPLEVLLANIKRIASNIFSSLHTMSKPKAADKASKADEADSEDEDLQQDALNNDTALLELVLKKLATLSEIQAKKSPIEASDLEALGDNDRALLKAFTQEVARTPSPPNDGESEESIMDPEELEDLLNEYLEDAGVLLQDFESWDFDIANLPYQKMLVVDKYILTHYRGIGFEDQCGEAGEWGEICTRFLNSVNIRHANTNPFHNFAHATDVIFSVHRFMVDVAADLFFSSTERFALVVAALAHDIAHPGLNNPFLIETGHELAIRYNDLSPLENMHCAVLFEICTSPGTRMFSGYERRVYQEIRHVCIEAILNTDYAQHFGMVKELQTIYDMNRELFDLSNEMYKCTGMDYPSKEVVEFFQSREVKKHLRNMTVHFCDISYPMKTWELCSTWAGLTQEEFFLQGDREASLGLPVQPLNDRKKVCAPYSQICFIEFFVVPFSLVGEKLIPPLNACTDILLENFGKWIGEWAASTSAPDQEEQNRIWDRISKLEAKRYVPP